MAKDRMAVLAAMIDQRVIPIFNHPDVEVCKKVVQACVNGGARCVELTNRGDFAVRVFYDVSSHFASADSSVIIGAGSIIDAPTAGNYIANGARFVVGSVLNDEVARLCNRRKIPYIPGCATATEISLAEELGCEIVKIFPGGAAGGPDFVAAILGPSPWTRVMATGGVDGSEESLRQWFVAGAACVAIGTKLITRELLGNQDYGGIEAKVRTVLQIARAIRSKDE